MIKKDAVLGEVIGDSSTPNSDELAKINTYTRRQLSADEVYVFSVVLCDNDVDRDGERFTVEGLFELEKLFVGKTGVIDHIPSAKNQTARIFDCEVEAVSGRKTALGDDYFRLRARAYLPRSEKNNELIVALDSGIIKEVSVGCAVERIVCSICGESIELCPHTKGESYSGRLCCGEMLNPYDAYEWSFVAVPAQREAGVTKSALRKEESMENILKKIESCERLELSTGECRELKGYIDELRKSAKDGVYYRENLTADVLRLSAFVQPEISRETMESVAKSMTVAQLNEFRTAFIKQKNESIAPSVQLYNEKEKKSNTVSNGQFRI